MQIVTFEEKHLPDAAHLAAARYRELRRQLPLMPAQYEDEVEFLPRLRDLLMAAPGVVAERSGRLVGFLAAWLLPSWHGHKAVYSPEWANGTARPGGGQIYQEMYASLSTCWVASGHYDHLVTLAAHDRDGIDGWRWLGFGHYVVDAMRGLWPLPGMAADVELRRALLDDIAVVSDLGFRLRRHLASSPTFLPDDEEHGRSYWEEWLSNPANALWLAHREGRAVAFLGQEPVSHDACTIVRDPGTTSITSTFAMESVRGHGVASALLNRCLEWAAVEGYLRCAVDFEAANILGARFWLRHFQPVCHSLRRWVDHP